jgi:salicylate hydroxylase
LIEAADVTTRWALHDIDPRPHWSSGRVTLLGDAAHAMMPYMAQGAVQAIEDAAVLGLCMSRADRKDVSKALVRYEQIRMPRTTQCQVGSRRSQAMFHLPDGEEQRLRDASYASGAVGSIASQAWLYGHDVEAEFEDG